MTVWGIVGIALLALLAVYFILCAALTYGALRRGPSEEPDPTGIKHYAPYAKQILDGVRWLREREPEEVGITSFDGLRLRGLYLPAENAR